jgi:hypothetical protein
MDGQKPFLHRLIERLTGSVIIGEHDPREWECQPLLIRKTDGELVFMGHATVLYRPGPKDTASVEVLIPNPPPGILVTEREAVHPISGGDGRREGLILRGFDSAGVAYEWRINGAAEASFLRQLDLEWTAVD